jgi:hypothetical protein
MGSRISLTAKGPDVSVSQVINENHDQIGRSEAIAKLISIGRHIRGSQNRNDANNRYKCRSGFHEKAQQNNRSQKWDVGAVS